VNCGGVGSFAAKSSTNTREMREQRAAFCTARLVPDFHQNHATPPLAVFCSAQLYTQVFALFLCFWPLGVSFQATSKYSSYSN
jgi:hypothetical protein